MAAAVLLYGKSRRDGADWRLPAGKIQAHHVLAVPEAGAQPFQHESGSGAVTVGDKGEIIVWKMALGAGQGLGKITSAPQAWPGEGGALAETVLQAAEGQGAGQNVILKDEDEKISVFSGKRQGGAVKVPAEGSQLRKSFSVLPTGYLQQSGSWIFLLMLQYNGKRGHFQDRQGPCAAERKEPFFSRIVLYVYFALTFSFERG